MAIVALSPNGVDHYRCARPAEGVLVATMDGVVHLELRSGRWAIAERALAGVHVSALAIDAPSGDAFAGSHGAGAFRRLAGGAWSAASTGLGSENVFSLAAAGAGSGLVLYAGTEPALLYRSRDRAASWDELSALRRVPGRDGWNFPAPPHVAHTKHVDFDPRDPQTIYVSIEQGALLKSVDGGATFRELVFQDESYKLNRDVHRVVFNPNDPDELFVPGGDGISRSRDAGATWEHLTTPAMRVGYPDATFYAPDGALYTTGGGTPPNVWRQTGDASAAVARSRDGGRTWTALALPALRGNIEAATLVSWPGGFGFFAGTTDGEVYASTDCGERWERIASALPPISKCVHYRNLQIGRGAA
jgi:photosystem II stability/assembly factor-like uncharacterized protein